ncbi:MAG: helix-turn-helix domain-containing protein [Pseudomonadota bacterium]
MMTALAHEGRMRLFRRLVQAGEGGMPAGDLARAEAINFTTASAQLSQLAQAGLAQRTREGRSIIYTADYTRIRSLIAFMMEDCCAGRREILQPLISLAQACCQPQERTRP